MTQKHLLTLNMAEFRYHGHLRQMWLAMLRFICGEAIAWGGSLSLITLMGHSISLKHSVLSLVKMADQSLEDHWRQAKGEFTCAQSSSKGIAM